MTELEQAVTLMRQRAKAAIHDGRDRWQVGKTMNSRSFVVVDDHKTPSVLIETWAKRYEDVNAHLAAIASPAVALAIADWLGSWIGIPWDPADYVSSDQAAAWRVARVYLGEGGEQR
jgi:hypothetical protein